jgi:hypothetical protein
VVIAVGWIDASIGRRDQVGIPRCGPTPTSLANTGGLGVVGHDGGQVRRREAQMPAEERARDQPGGDLAPKPRLAHPQQGGGLGRGVEQLSGVTGVVHLVLSRLELSRLGRRTASARGPIGTKGHHGLLDWKGPRAAARGHSSNPDLSGQTNAAISSHDLTNPDTEINKT